MENQNRLQGVYQDKKHPKYKEKEDNAIVYKKITIAIRNRTG